MSTESRHESKYVFLRKSSGLVKVAGFWDVFIYNLGLISVGIGVAYTQRFGPAYYPNGSLPLAIGAATLIMVAVGLALWCWTVAIPRSGGIYVFLTRAGLNATGFALSFVECISWLFYVGIAAALFTTVGLIPFFALMSGPGAGSVALLSRPSTQLAIGTIAIWLPAWLLILGTRRYFAVQKAAFIVAIVATLVLLVVLFSPNSRPTFVANFNATFENVGQNASDAVVEKAKSGGWDAAAGSSISLLVWPFLALIGGAFSIGIGGEVQQTARNQFLGILGSIGVAGALIIAIAVGGAMAVGHDFQGALAWNYDGNAPGSAAFTTPFPPYFPYLAGLATNNTVARALISLGFLAWVYFWIPGVLSYVERAFLAWSLDRVAPAALARLHPRWGTPYVAVLLAASIAEIFLVLTLYTTFFATLVFILAAGIAWWVTLIMGVAFPSRARHLYEGSEIAVWRIGGLSLMRVSSAIAAAAMLLVIVLLLSDPLAAGHGPNSVGTLAVVFAIGFLLFHVAKGVRRRQGVVLESAYREIPVE